MKATVFIPFNAHQPAPVISPLLHGQFAEHLGACIYGGIWRNGQFHEPTVRALADLHIPLLRWPGGCFADDYHWRDGIGPRETRPRTVNIHWGHPVEDNSFGTHEFITLCRRIGAEPYFAGNVGSGTVQEFRDWVEYCNFAGDSSLAMQRAQNGSPDPLRVQWWGVGNENWGCGGNFCPEDYAAEYKRYASFLPDFPGAPLKLIACGPGDNNGDWTRRFFDKLGSFRRIHAYAAHFYTVDWQGKYGSSTGYTDRQFYEMLAYSRQVETLIREQRALMNGWDPTGRIGLVIDEWGTWHHPTDKPPAPRYELYQQSTVRDALIAAMTLDIFHNHAESLVMANIAQVVNVLQAMLLVSPDGQVVKTPTYHVFDLYRAHQGANLLASHWSSPDAADGLPAVSGSASRQGDTFTLTLVNTHLTDAAEVTVSVGDARLSDIQTRTITAGDSRACNTYDAPEQVQPTGWQPASLSPLVLPPASATRVQATLG